ncbi:MAG: transcription antitermination factor NusB [Lachnospiraceae bacterium]|nr:transcription antitermination factor NusB [Lachnospiraceae bacterium]
MKRRELREEVFKLLFRVEFNAPDDMPEQVKLFLEERDEPLGEKECKLVSERYDLIREKVGEIDDLLNKNIEKWNTERIGKVELTVLRIAVFEMLFDEDIPVTVAINEAVEIAKKYGQDNSGSFVNAILAKFVKTGD